MRQKIDELSDRELEVLWLTAWGYLLREIGAHLGIGEKAAMTYRTRATEKLGITSRTGIVRYALENNWFAVDPEKKQGAAAGVAQRLRPKG
jgi:DNA-binding CsgD family transcriptional regulator